MHQPTQRIATPSPTSGIEWPGIAPRPAVGAVFAGASAEQQQRGQRPGCAGQVDHRGAGEVEHLLAADVVEQSVARPDRVRDQRVDDRPEDGRVDHVGAEPDPLQGGAPDDRQRDGAENRPNSM